MNQQLIEQIVKEVMSSMGTAQTQAKAAGETKKCATIDPKKDYPLGVKRTDLIKTPTNKTLDDITLKGVMDGSVTPKDIRIAPETLELQAQVAESMGRKPLAQNFRRASELISVPDDRILEIYNALRPGRSSKEEMLAIAEELETQYNAKINGKLIRDAADVYEKRGILRED